MNLVLENYVAVANMIADTFGDHCKVILHGFFHSAEFCGVYKK